MGSPHQKAFEKTMTRQNLADPSTALESKLRCSPFHLSLHADPIGSAGNYDGFVCVEVTPPWERDISLNEPYRSLLNGDKIAIGADGRRWRPQGLARQAGSTDSTVVMAFDRPELGSAGPYRRREWQIDPAQVLSLCRAIVDDTEALRDFEDFECSVDGDVIDLLICTHGQRDVCCGSLGSILHKEVAPELAARDDVRVWRTSHTGGHRFAATALTFPDGYAWAHLNSSLIHKLISRNEPAAEVVANCRGLSSLPTPAAQLADRVALEQLGWTWAAAERSIHIDEAADGTAAEIQLSGQWPNGAVASISIKAEIDRYVPQPTCGALGAEAHQVEAIWRLSEVTDLQI